MKTYYFTQYWEDEWECGDGCCSGGGEWVIDFQEMVDENGKYCYNTSIGTSWTIEDALRQVYEIECGEDIPEFVWFFDSLEIENWLVRHLHLKGVEVVFKEQGEK